MTVKKNTPLKEIIVDIKKEITHTKRLIQIKEETIIELSKGNTIPIIESIIREFKHNIKDYTSNIKLFQRCLEYLEKE